MGEGINMTNVETKYDRFSHIYDAMEVFIEAIAFKKWRKEAFSPLHGKILDVGVGTGKNLPYYAKDAEITGIDISHGMLEHAQKRAKEMDNVKLMHMDAGHLEFDDDTFDYVVTSFVLCTIPDPVAALFEMRRVCKPSGKLVMLEHVRSKNRLIAFFEDLLNPIPRVLVGTNINRDTVGNVKKAGFVDVTDTNIGLWDVFKRITTSNAETPNCSKTV